MEILNVGGALNLTSGKFTVPRNGTYSFSFSGLVEFPASSSNAYINVGLRLNGNGIGSGHADEVGTAVQYELISFQSILNLRKGDQIWIESSSISAGVSLLGTYYTHFSGYLIEENITIA